MVGGGQLARMTHQAVIALGQSLRVLSAGPDESAALVAHDVVIGAHDSYDDLRALAEGCDVVTFDHEHVPGELISRLAGSGVDVRPSAEALLFAQDKLAMRERLAGLGVAVPRWAEVRTQAEIERFADGRWPIVLKAARGGYDGRGVWVVPDVETATRVLTEAHAAGIRMLAEEKVDLHRELAAVIARSPFGQVSTWPVVQTVQESGICVEVIAPAPDLDEELAGNATELAIRIATALDVTGILAVELFETRSPEGEHRILVNELAMRPHNSAHWTIEGSRTSQFEQHVRAVLDYPLGSTGMTAPHVVMANVIGGAPGGTGIDERVHHLMASWPHLKLHLYGKAVRPGRKIGHVTGCGGDLAALRADTAAAAAYLRDGGTP